MAGHNVSVKNLRGEQGTFTISDTTQYPVAPAEAQWANFVAITDVVIAAIELPKESGDVAALLGVVYPQGFVFDGPIHSITLTSGVARMYNFIDPSKEAARQTMNQR